MARSHKNVDELVKQLIGENDEILRGLNGGSKKVRK